MDDRNAPTEFSRLAGGADGGLDAGRLALLIAEAFDNRARAGDSLADLDALAGRLKERLVLCADDDQRLDRLVELLAAEEKFHGNRRDYYNPRNSFLNEVLASRAGIPVTLSLVYLEVARRVGLPLRGVAFPGHFLTACDCGEETIYLDPFNGGRRLDEAGCRRFYREITGGRDDFSPRFLRPANPRQILARLLGNLKSIYLKNEDWGRALVAVQHLVWLDPRDPEPYRERGALHLQLANYPAAAADFRRYLGGAPDAEDFDEISLTLKELDAALASVN